MNYETRLFNNRTFNPSLSFSTQFNNLLNFKNMTVRTFIMEELNKQAQNISKKSVEQCRESLQLTDQTMNKYLAGNGSKVDVYESIINFFKNYPNV